MAVQLGHKRTANLTVADCDQFLAKAAQGLIKADGSKRKPIGKPQLKRIRNKLIAALRNDIRIGTINRNAAELSVLPANTKPKPQRRSLTRSQLADLYSAATGATGILIDFSGRNGLRPAEARAMVWDNINFDQQTMTITHQLNRNDEHVGPKTKRVARTIHLDQTTITKLKAWRTIQHEQRTYAGPAWQERNIIATTASGTPIQRNNYARSMRQLCKVLKIEPHVTPYELRHTAISLQAEAGQTPWNIADWASTSEK